MHASPLISPATSAFNPFLYAAIGDDKNGMELTVLSALARQNVDPWEAAAALNRLPAESALKKLVSMLDALPGQALPADRTAIAGRLMSLLPSRSAITGRSEGATHPPEKRSRHLSELPLVMIYLALMFVGQWVYLREVATAHERSETEAVTPPVAAQSQPSASRKAP